MYSRDAPATAACFDMASPFISHPDRRDSGRLFPLERNARPVSRRAVARAPAGPHSDCRDTLTRPVHSGTAPFPCLSTLISCTPTLRKGRHRSSTSHHDEDVKSSLTSSPAETLVALRELVEAIDRRVPHAERPGEVRISKDAALLRSEAVRHIEALLRDQNRPADQDLIDAIMADDGNPTPGGGVA